MSQYNLTDMPPIIVEAQARARTMLIVGCGLLGASVLMLPTLAFMTEGVAPLLWPLGSGGFALGMLAAARYVRPAFPDPVASS